MATQQHKPLSTHEISAFCSQMAMILKSGISSIEGISIMLEDTHTSEETSILKQMEETFTATGCFCEALKSTQVFPDYMIHMVDIGEKSGKLDEVMESLSDHYERETGIANAIRHAVTYPFIMIAMMMIVILVLIMKVLPIFQQVFQQLGREMTGVSGAVLKLSAVLNRYSVILVIVLVLCAALFLYGFCTAKGRRLFARIAAKSGKGRSVSDKIASCRFASGMALTLSSGLDTDQSLALSGALIEQPQFREKLTTCRQLLEDGAEFSAALTKSGIFSGIHARMVTVGYKTGSLDSIMRKIARNYEDEIDDQMSRLIAVLEPTLVAVLSIIVGLILLSVMLPLIGIMSGL